MRQTIHLDEEDLQEAISLYVESKNFGKAKSVSITQHGYLDSPDPRETRVYFSASVEVETKREGKTK